MNTIKWKESENGKYANAKIGAIELSCNTWYTGDKKLRYLAQISFRPHVSVILGGLKKSMSGCKKEAIDIVRNMLEDYYVAIKAEMANFDMLPDDEGD